MAQVTHGQRLDRLERKVFKRRRVHSFSFALHEQTLFLYANGKKTSIHLQIAYRNKIAEFFGNYNIITLDESFICQFMIYFPKARKHHAQIVLDQAKATLKVIVKRNTLAL